MTPDKMNQLLALIDELVDDDSIPWAEKRTTLLQQSSAFERIALEEFASWFEEDSAS